jgi:hypothetical protein
MMLHESENARFAWGYSGDGEGEKIKTFLSESTFTDWGVFISNACEWVRGLNSPTPMARSHDITMLFAGWIGGLPLMGSVEAVGHPLWLENDAVFMGPARIFANECWKHVEHSASGLKAVIDQVADEIPGHKGEKRWLLTMSEFTPISD